MAKQWITAKDLAGKFRSQDTSSGEDTSSISVPLSEDLQKDLDYMWTRYLPALGFTGQVEHMVPIGYDSEGGGMAEKRMTPEARKFIQDLQAKGIDLVAFEPNWQKRNRTFAIRMPDGQIVNESTIDTGNDVADFFRQFLLPAAGMAFTMGGGLNALMGGGSAAAPTNALAGIAEGMVPGGLTAAGIPATAAELAAVGAITGGAPLTAADIGGGLGDVLGQAGQTPVVEAVDLASMGSLPPPLSPEIQELILSETLPASAAAPAMGSLPPPLPPGIQNLISSETLPASAASLTGVPVLDKAIDLVTSPAGQAVVGAAGSVASGVMQANAAESAANQQSEAARNALQLQREMFEYQKGLLEPYRTAGTAALKRLEGALGLGGTAQAQQMLEMDPGYGFRLGEGMKALERMQAARGNMLSGGALKAGQQYAQNFASNEYDRAFGRLADIAGIGRSTAAQQGTAAQQFGTSAGNVMGQEANALAAGRIGRGSAYSGAIQGGLNAFQNYFNRQQEEQLFRDIFGRTAVGS